MISTRPTIGARAEPLVEDEDPRGDGDDRGDVGDHQRSSRSDLGDQRAEEDEGSGGAEHAEHDDRRERVVEGVAEGRSSDGERGQQHRCDRQRPGHQRPRVEVRHVALEHHRPGRVADRGDQDRAGTEQLVGVPGDVDPDQGDHAREPDEEADQSHPADPLGAIEAERPRGTATISGVAAIRIAAIDELTCSSPAAISGKRDDDLGDRVGEEPAHPPAQGAEDAGPPCEGQQHERPEHDAGPGEEGGRHAAVHRNADEQVRDAPEDGDDREGRPGARAHGRAEVQAGARRIWSPITGRSSR